MTTPEAEVTPRRGLLTKSRLITAAVVGVIVVALVVITQMLAHQAQARMVAMFPDDVVKDAALTKMAISMAI